MNLNKILQKNLIALSTLSLFTFFALPAFSFEIKDNTINLSDKSGKITLNNKENQSPASILSTQSDFKISNSLSPGTTIFGLPQNMGPIDRILRGVIAAGLIGTGVYGLSTGNINSAVSCTLIGVSVIPIATAELLVIVRFTRYLVWIIHFKQNKPAKNRERLIKTLSFFI